MLKHDNLKEIVNSWESLKARVDSLVEMNTFLQQEHDDELLAELEQDKIKFESDLKSMETKRFSKINNLKEDMIS